MRVSAVKIAGSFKRFGSLEISSIGLAVELVVMLGPNGSGKSSVFDAFLEWARQQGRDTRDGVQGVYFEAESGSYRKPEVTLHDSVDASERPGSLLHARTAHRNTPGRVGPNGPEAA